MHVVLQFLRDLRQAVDGGSTRALLDVTDPERVAAIVEEAEAALGEPQRVILAVLGPAVVRSTKPAFQLRVRRRPPWGGEVFEAAMCDEDGKLVYDEPIAWSLYRCTEILPRNTWRLGAGEGEIYFLEPVRA